MKHRRASLRVVAAIVFVTLGLVASGLPASAAPEPSTSDKAAAAPEAAVEPSTVSEPTAAEAPNDKPAAPATQQAPAEPPVMPTLPEAPPAEPAPPLPTGPIPERPKDGEEIVDRRTAESRTFSTDTIGQFRTEVYTEAVNFKDPATGAYEPIDASLAESKDGVRQSKANAFVLELADDANAATVARLRLDEDHSVGFALEGAGAVKASTDDKTSTYAGAKDGVELRLTSRPDGLKEELVLASAAAGDRFVFPLELDGLSATIDDIGDVVYRDKAGDERARTPRGFMTDAALDPLSDEAPMSTGVTYALVPHGKGTALEVTLDKEWLADPARTWPVVLDPQITVAAGADDTYVMSGFHRDNSHDLELKVGTYDGGSHVGRSFMQFNTSAINGKAINWAQLNIAESHSWNCSSAWPTVHRVTAGWTGSGLQDWPGIGFDATPAGNLMSATGSCNGRVLVYDVTSAATVWAANNASYGLALDTSASDNNLWKKFASTETGAPPALTVNWTDPPPPPSGNPFGFFDAAYPVVGGVRVIGWTADPDGPPTAPIYAHVYRDGVFVEALLADNAYPGVNAAYPGYGDNHGYDDFAPMSAGSHNVCIYEINVGPGTHTGPLCRTVVVPARGANEPFGALDSATPSSGGATVVGWTIDPDTVSAITVQVWSGVDYKGTLTANTSRPDVGAVYPIYGNNHGYSAFVALAPGYQNVCLFAVNTGAGTNHPLLGCKQVSITAATAPSAPTNVAAVANIDGSTRVTWNLSASDGGSPITLYAIYALNADLSWSHLYRVECTTCTSTSFSGLVPGNSYFYAVYALNAVTFSAPASSATIVSRANGAGAMPYFSLDSYALTDSLSAQVNVGTGNLLISASDASVPVVGGSRSIGRTYNSASVVAGASAPTSPVLGPGWRFSESPDHRLVPHIDDSVTYLTPSGANPTFTGAPLVAPAGFDATLVREGDGTFTLTFPDSAQVLRFRSDGLLTSDTDRNANAVSFTYPGGGGYPATVTGNAGTGTGKVLNISYGGPGGKINTLTRTAGAVTATVAYTYDTSGRLQTVTDAENGVSTFVYDSANRITQITDVANHVTNFTYDGTGRVATVTRVIPGANAVTTYDYATANHTKVTDPNGNPLTDYTFEPFGALKSAVDARGATSTLGWTSELKVGTVTDGLLAVITNLLGANSGQSQTRLTGATGAFGETGGYGSGVTARLPSWTKDTMGNQTLYGYNANGNLTSATDPLMGVSSVTRNTDGTVASSAMPAQPTNPTTYGYTDHQVTSVTPPTGNSLGASSSTYDGFGRLWTSTSPAGMTTTLGYNRLDRVLTQSHSDSSPTITYVYGAAGTLTSRADATGSTGYTYDAANRPLSKTTPTGAVSYTWDRAGNMLTATDPAGTTTYHYDKVNRLDQVTEPVTGRKDVFAYDVNGRRTDSWTNTGADVAYSGNNVVAPTSFALHEHSTYNTAGQLTGLKTTRASSDANANRVSDLAYTYTTGSTCAGVTAERVTAIRHSVNDILANKLTSYCYDINGRLTSAATAGGPTYTYSFDANTNRTSGPEGTHTFNSGDQLTDTGFTYNANGDLTAGSMGASAYNGMSQTESITPTGGSATAYTYAGAGQTERTTAGATTAVHGLGLATETTGGVTSSYIRDAWGSLIAERTPAGDFYYVFDGLGSVIALVDPSGTQRAAYTYDPYGDHATATAMNGALPPNPWRWSASYLDATGLYKLGARYYDPSLGRFTQVDPVAGGSANDYDYANGDPVNNDDVTGLMSERKKKQVKKVRAGLQKQVDIHKEKIRQELEKEIPDQGLIGHWQKEINTWERDIGKIDTILKWESGPSVWESARNVAGGLVTVWVAGKALAPACGPALPACAIIL